ncbi:MAG: hypothetical protein MI741_22355, partial [Rhodospirillales bacterium]|nr:hypothetical protein [Rhodospirillales bacterium]
AVALGLMVLGVGVALALDHWIFEEISVITHDMHQAAAGALIMLPAACFGCVWAIRLTHKRFERTIRRMMVCYRCGYDLRGNPTAVMCPECGGTVQPNDTRADAHRPIATSA